MIDFTKDELVDILKYLDAAYNDGFKTETWNSITSKIAEELKCNYNYKIHLKKDKKHNTFDTSYFGLSDEKVAEEELTLKIIKKIYAHGCVPLEFHITSLETTVYGIVDNYLNINAGKFNPLMPETNIESIIKQEVCRHSREDLGLHSLSIELHSIIHLNLDNADPLEVQIQAIDTANGNIPLTNTDLKRIGVSYDSTTKFNTQWIHSHLYI